MPESEYPFVYLGGPKQTAELGQFRIPKSTGGPSFYAWRKRLKGKIQPVGFALVETAAVGQQRGQAMELILSSGERLQIGSRAQRRAQ